MLLTSAWVIATVLLQTGQAPPAAGTPSAAPAAPAVAAAPPAPAPAPAYVPERVYDTRRRAFVDFEVMVADIGRADVVFVGEQHDDPNTHRLEHALVDGMRRRRMAVTVSFEMFERDVQDAVSRYLSGAIDEPEFVKTARPWPRYATDYRPMLELARNERWPVVAANVPRRLASDVAKSGKDAIDRFSATDRAFAAKDLECPRDAYFERFTSAMGGHAEPKTPPADAKAPAAEAKPAAPAEQGMVDRYYWSQCLKDETMAESIARAVGERPSGTGAVVHFTGSFHSDFGQGTAERARRRLPGRRVAVVSMLPVADLDTLAPSDEDLRRADYLVYTVK